MDRPVTSKARGVCKYYTESRGCYAGDSCKFLHGDTKLSPYDQSKKCRFYAKGFCKKGKHCWFKHVDPPNELPKDEEEETCCICFEKPLTFGLLSGCSHVFCLECIRQWRDPNGKQADVVFSGNTKKCPMCRASSKFITPSSRFYPTDDPQRERTTLAYKESMGRVSCKYYQDSISSPSGTPFCPFGKDCFYQHKNKDGTSYIFNDGVDKYMPVHQARQSDYTFTFNLASLLEFATGADDLVGPDIADRSGQSLDEVMEGADGAQNRRDVNDARHDRSTTVLQAVEAIRAGLERIAGQRLVAGAVGQAEEHPPGFGWLSQIPDPGRVIDRLETLTREVGNSLRRRNGPPPPLEPMEPFNRGFSDPRDEDDTHSMPGLESVSNSSDEEYEDVQEFVDESSSSDVDEHDETHPWRLAPNYNILGEIVDWQSLDQAESERSAPIRPPEEPQFVTDGRGRVVGSTSAAPASPRDKGTDEHGRTNQGSGLAGDDEGGN